MVVEEGKEEEGEEEHSNKQILVLAAQHFPSESSVAGTDELMAMAIV